MCSVAFIFVIFTSFKHIREQATKEWERKRTARKKRAQPHTQQSNSTFYRLFFFFVFFFAVWQPLFHLVFASLCSDEIDFVVDSFVCCSHALCILFWCVRVCISHGCCEFYVENQTVFISVYGDDFDFSMAMARSITNTSKSTQMNT